MTKKITALMLCILLAVGWVPRVQATSEADLRQSIQAQVEAYAGTVYRKNAADDAVDVMLKQALYGKGKTLHFSQTDAVRIKELRLMHKQLSVARALANSENYEFPMEIGGEIMLPLLPMLDFMGYGYQMSAGADEITVATGGSRTVITLGEGRAAVGDGSVALSAPMAYLDGGENMRYLVISMGDVSSLFPGWYITSDAMGLVILSRTEEIYNRFDDLGLMLDVMKEFVFDYPTGEEIYNDVKEFTNNFTHPYILTNADELAHLRSIYQDGMAGKQVDRNILAALVKYVQVAEDRYRIYALSSTDPVTGYDEWIGPNPEATPTNPHAASGGYDPEGGRLEILEDYAGDLFNLAIGYQLTLNDKYVYCGYYMMLALGEWEHWGPRHMLNTADGAFEITMFFDWTYDACVRLGLDVGRLEQILYDKAVYQGWRTTQNPGVGGLSKYTQMINNWNAVCTSGLGITALAIMGNSAYSSVSSRLLSSNLASMVRIGLDQYAPDGTYAESVQYWGYATNVFFTLCMALDNAAGTDYGLMNLWGIEDTSYFACHTESSDHNIFTYNDASGGPQCTYFFFYCSNKYDDPVLSAIRLQQLRRGKSCAIYDLLEYPFDGVDAKVDLPLDYMARAIDIYTARSDWNRGALYVGIMGGSNNIYGHGHIDGGSFVYHNQGTIWFNDLGSEDYNVYGYWNNNYRYRYYRLNAEGHNTLCLTSAPLDVPYGQTLDGYAPITDYASYDVGSYVTYDMTEYFGGHAESWRRGMLLTNDRETVVVQDQVTFKQAETVYWFAHYSKTSVKSVEITNNGKTAYFNGPMESDGRILRVSLVGDKSLRFKLMNCYELVNVGSRGTYTSEQVSSMGNGVSELSRDEYMKLAIVGRDVTEFNVAVVIEVISDTQDVEVGYKWQDMSEWMPTEDNRTVVDLPPPVPTRGEPDLTKLVSLKNKYELFLKGDDAYSDRLEDLYRALTDMAYIFRADELAKYNPKYEAYYLSITERAAEYDAFVSGINREAERAGSILRGTMPSYFIPSGQ